MARSVHPRPAKSKSIMAHLRSDFGIEATGHPIMTSPGTRLTPNERHPSMPFGSDSLERGTSPHAHGGALGDDCEAPHCTARSAARAAAQRCTSDSGSEGLDPV